MLNGPTTFDVNGMSCEHCVRAVTEAVSAIPGASDVRVDLSGGTVAFVAADVSEAAVVDAIDDAGYDATLHHAP
ncbi:Copper chaperone CopZ [Corynebacterium heidelbergense]|uniref:HMA domain-containing protein n=2 Tax=Corynebacterium heidelbergense TaxID=2055947 RepID=A0A364VDD3_9CORY|nr:hypothetical protein CWC39_02140 [Corynebacterium heidelbergense]WCZ36187.1 Copper chaperone CopZ [Corynebacterium heidelbergense]